MPSQNMIRNRKGLIEALMRIIIMAVLVVIVFNIGKKVAEAAFGGNDALQSLENLANEMDSLREGQSTQAFLSMDEGMAVIGFGKSGNEFRCYGCEQATITTFTPTILYSSVAKPSNKECSNSACICACFKSTLNQEPSGNFKINCESTSCKSLKFDIPKKISLDMALKSRNIQIATYPYWENGFFFVRSNVGKNTPLNGMPYNFDRKITLYIEKKLANNEILVAACPLAPCIQEQK